MTVIFWIACLWIIGAPVGYALTRWSSRAMLGRWTNNDRLYAIIVSAIYGPMMVLITAVIMLLDRLSRSQWGNREAGW